MFSSRTHTSYTLLKKRKTRNTDAGHHCRCRFRVEKPSISVIPPPPRSDLAPPTRSRAIATWTQNSSVAHVIRPARLSERHKLHFRVLIHNRSMLPLDYPS